MTRLSKEIISLFTLLGIIGAVWLGTLYPEISIPIVKWSMISVVFVAVWRFIYEFLFGERPTDMSGE